MIKINQVLLDCYILDYIFYQVRFRAHFQSCVNWRSLNWQFDGNMA